MCFSHHCKFFSFFSVIEFIAVSDDANYVIITDEKLCELFLRSFVTAKPIRFIAVHI